MIVNNYNNTLPENVETALSFYSLQSPYISLRDFDYNLTVGDRLVIPFYVSDSQQREYRYNKVGPTFTTIIRFDEDTVPDEDVHEYKVTTYAGEQIADIGDASDLFEVGAHSFSMRTIQSNGVSSPTRYYKFIIRIPESEMPVLDFSNGESFTATFDNYTWYNMNGTAKCIKNVSSASYAVSTTKINGQITDIRIVVTNGNIVRTKPDGTRYGSSEKIYDLDITGEYHVATTCVVDGSTVNLLDYLGTPKNSIPTNVTLAAAKNKVALTRLFEAAKAYFCEHYEGAHGIFKIPEMNLVCSYNNANGTTTEDEFKCRDDIWVPNDITIDFNNTCISALMTSRLAGGRILYVLNNFNTQLKNCKLVGNWKNYNFTSTKESESVHMVTVHSSKFCNIYNFDISFSLGYEMHIGGYKAAPSMSYGAGRPFTDCGYIDYNGEVHSLDDNEIGLMYTGGNDGFRALSTSYVQLTGNAFKIHKEDGDLSERHRQQCRELFVHYYDDNNNFVKTVKVSEIWPILWPYGATKYRLTAYGSRYVRGSLDSLNKSGNTKSNFVKAIPNSSWCSGMYNSKIHDTRTCILDNGGTQTMVNSCIFWNIAGERKDTGCSEDQYYYTKVLADFEDDAVNLFSTILKNCELVYGDVRTFNFKFGYDSQMINCRNISTVYYHDVVDGAIINSSGTFSRHTDYRCVDPKTVLKNTLFDNVTANLSSSKTGAATGNIWLQHCTVIDDCTTPGGIVPPSNETKIIYEHQDVKL